MQYGYDKTEALKITDPSNGGIGYELTLQERLLEELHEAITSLSQKMTPFLLPEGPSPAEYGAGGDDSRGNSEVSGRVSMNSDSIRRQIVRVRELEGRVHL